MKKFLCLLCFSIFACASDYLEYHRTSEIPVTNPMAKGTKYGDLNSYLVSLGVDYPVLLQKVTEGDSYSLKLFLLISENLGIDGAAAEGYGYYLTDVIEAIGDKKVAEVAKELDKKTKESLKLYLLDMMGVHSPKEEVGKKASEKAKAFCPQLWEVLTLNEHKEDF